MKIHQFEDKGLAHFSYAVLSEDARKIVLIDPARNPQPYYDYAEEQEATIVGVIETHPHADFVSAHLEIHQSSGATIYTSKLVGADYPHQAFDEGDVLEIGDLKFKALNTPGHSPDSISIVLEHEGKDRAVFTGDTLFIGDVGRPDLREKAGKITAKRQEMARQMYHSTREKLMKLEDSVKVYPAHGSGSLCGKALSEANSSSIGAEKAGNYALQPMQEEAFVKLLLENQPFVPKYFPYDVAVNKSGAPAYQESLKRVPRLEKNYGPKAGVTLVDGRPQQAFKKSHLPNAINIQNGEKFETWLGSLVSPDESYYLLAGTEKELDELIAKAAKIGYEAQIAGAFVYARQSDLSSEAFPKETFKANPDAFTVLDIRNASELENGKLFKNALHIPLPELRERKDEIPYDKPVVVHCAGGYRSAAGSSILEGSLETTVMDMSEAVKEFKK